MMFCFSLDGRVVTTYDDNVKKKKKQENLVKYRQSPSQPTGKRSSVAQSASSSFFFIQHLLPVLIILILSFVIYANTLNNGFAYDDINTITTNSLIKNIRNLTLLVAKNYPEMSTELSYRPIVTLTYFFDYFLFGLNPTGYHFINILLHSINGILLYFFINHLLTKPTKALLITLLFVSHPVLTEAVNSISFREDLLAFLFFMGALNSYVFVIRKESTDQARSWSLHRFPFIISYILYFLALLSKEMAATLPLVLYCYDWLYKDRSIKKRNLFNRYYIGYIFVTVAYLYLRFYVFYRPFPSYVTPWGVGERILTIPWLIVNYIKLAIFPISLSADYDIPSVKLATSLNFFVPLSFLFIFLIITLQVRKLTKEITFGSLFFLITLMPVYNLIPTPLPFAERYIYLPAAGIILVMGLFIYNTIEIICNKYKIRYIFVFIPFILILSTYALIAIQRNNVWKDNYSLWSDTVKKMPTLSRAHFSLGSEYAKKREYDNAIEQFQAALKLKPDYGDVYLNLGTLYTEKEQFDEAMKYYQNALKFSKSDLHYIYNGIGVIYLRLGLFDEAIKNLQTAVKLNPLFYVSHYNLGIAYMKQRMDDIAKIEFETALKLNPDDPDSKKNLQLIEATHNK